MSESFDAIVDESKYKAFVYLTTQINSLCPIQDDTLISEIRRLISSRKGVYAGWHEILCEGELLTEDEQRRYDLMMQRLSEKSP
jgi:hypothetical protein